MPILLWSGITIKHYIGQSLKAIVSQEGLWGLSTFISNHEFFDEFPQNVFSMVSFHWKTQAFPFHQTSLACFFWATEAPDMYIKGNYQPQAKPFVKGINGQWLRGFCCSMSPCWFSYVSKGGVCSVCQEGCYWLWHLCLRNLAYIPTVIKSCLPEKDCKEVNRTWGSRHRW